MVAAATDKDITIYQGADDTITIAVVDENGSAVAITDALDIVWTLSVAAGGQVVATKSLGSGISISDGPGGVFAVTIDRADVADLWGTYRHVARLTDAANKVSVVTVGAVTIERAN